MTSLVQHAALAAHRAFLLWRLENHPTDPTKGFVKVPLHPDGVTHHSLKHPAMPLVASEAAWYLDQHLTAGNGHARRGEVGYLGIGFRPNPANRLVCLDLDDCIDEHGVFDSNAQQWVAFFADAALEVSVGGRGLHIWFTHQGEGPGRRGKRTTPVGSLEMYGEGQFIALGTYLCGNPMQDCTAQMRATLDAYFPAAPRRSGEVTLADWHGKTLEQQAIEVENIRSALRRLDPDDRDTWVAQGQALTCLGDTGRALWEEWSGTSERFPGGSNLEKWDTFTGDRADYRSVFSKAQALGWVNPGSVAPAKEWTETIADGYKECDSEQVITDKLNGVTPVRITAQQAFGLRMKLPELWAPNAADLTDPAKVSGMRTELLWWLMRMYGGNCAAVEARLAGHELTKLSEDLRTEILRACGGFLAWWTPIAEQRAADRALVAEAAASLPVAVVPTVITLEDAMRDLVHVTKGQYVTVRKTGVVLSWSDACAEFAASEVEVGTEGKKAPVLGLWRKRTERLTTGLLTWRPGEAEFCAPVMSIEGHRSAYNTWRGFYPAEPPANWRDWAALFERHVAYLVPVETERRRFLQWLGHMVQHPGELPHTAYLMVTEQTGTGRGWLANALALAVQGYTALGVPLGNILDGGFTGVLSQKLLVTVDEVRAGGESSGKGKHARAEKLKELVTQWQRHINHKYGAEVVEQNCGRWLIFSNHLDALPFDNKDRRLIVIENPAERQSPEWYTALYQALKAPEFAASLFEFLRTMPLDGFNAGEAASSNAAKTRAIQAMTSVLDQAVERFVAEWPAPYSTDRDMRRYVSEDMGETAGSVAVSYAKRRVGIETLDGRPKIGAMREKVLRLRETEETDIETMILEARKKMWD